MDRWSIAHRYNKLVKAGLAAPLTAPDGTEYVLRANKEYEPCYWCPSDDSTMTPGSAWWMRTSYLIDQIDLDTLSSGVLH